MNYVSHFNMKEKQPLIAIDLELEQPYTNQQTPDSKLDKSKIIQLGWVVFNDEKVLKECRRYVNIGVPLSKFIKDLTKITDEQIAGLGITLAESYADLVADQKEYNTSRVVRQWGGGDMEHLKMEIETETGDSPKWEFGRSGFNVKHLYQAYALENGMNTSGGLSKCMARCDLIWQGRGKHDALLDAHNTARFYNLLAGKLKESNNENSI